MGQMLMQKKAEATEEEAEPSGGMVLQNKRADAASTAVLPDNRTVQKRQNHTGMPDKLKAGVETLSGMSMDHVRVHYNSDKPAQLQAHAYAQGNQIHLARGQEKHLPHEAWHVVQQAQGRVRPTMQMKEGVPINDDQGLEHEADVMGAKALTVQRFKHQSRSKPFLKSASQITCRQPKWLNEKGNAVIQCLLKNDSDKPTFFDLTPIKLSDEVYFYLFHGTLLKNVEGISIGGLDPTHGGGQTGAALYEGATSKDSRGRIKYAVDPNIAIKYAKGPTENKDQQNRVPGALLMARVERAALRRQWAQFVDPNGPKAWGPESGGENAVHASYVKKFAFNHVDSGLTTEKQPMISAIETNMLLPASDIRVVGFYLLPKTELDEVPYMKMFNQEKLSTAITFDGEEITAVKGVWSTFPPPEQIKAGR